MNKLSFFFTLTIFVTICSASTQSPALTNNCSEHMVNFQGTCYQQIPNCQYYISGTKCIKCQQNFTLINYRCDKSDITPQTLLFTLQIKKNSTSKNLTKQNMLWLTDISNFNNIKNIVSIKHPNMTSTQNQPVLKNFVKTPFNSYFGFTWTTSKNRTFLFEYSLSQNGQCSQIIADLYDPNLENSWFGKIHEKLTDKYSSKLYDATLTKIASISKNLYKFHYYTDLGFHYIAFVQKIPYLEIKLLEQAPWNYDEPEMLNFIYSQHPYFAMESSYVLSKRPNTSTLQYEIKFNSGAKVVIQEFPMQRERIIFLCQQENITVPSSSKPVGGFQPLVNTEDQIVRKILSNIYSQFNFLKNSQITKIQYQIVSGTNFMIYLKDNNGNDQYVCKVFYSLTREINILEIYMNSVLIHTHPLAPLQINANYDFSSDPIFQKVNQILANSSFLNVTKKISYVNKLKKTINTSTFYQFQVVYSQNTFFTVTYFVDGPRAGQIRIKDLVNEGDLEEQNVRDIRKIAGFLSSYRKWLSPLLVTYIKETKPKEYLLKGITGSGSYFFKIVDQNVTGLNITYYELIDEKEKCLTHSADDIQQFQLSQMQFLKIITTSQKIDPLSELVSLSEGITNQQITYRLLFSNPSTYQKMEVYATAQSNGLQINKIQPQNNGFGLLIDSAFYGKATQKAVNSFCQDLTGSTPLFGMMNSSVVNLYFQKQNDQNETVYRVQMNLSLQNPIIEVFFQKESSQNCQKQNSQSITGQCEEKIKGCLKQIGSQCLICDTQYSLVNNQCINECSYFM